MNLNVYAPLHTSVIDVHSKCTLNLGASHGSVSVKNHTQRSMAGQAKNDFIIYSNFTFLSQPNNKGDSTSEQLFSEFSPFFYFLTLHIINSYIPELLKY